MGFGLISKPAIGLLVTTPPDEKDQPWTPTEVGSGTGLVVYYDNTRTSQVLIKPVDM